MNVTVCVVLLVDSEGPTSEGLGVWSHLKDRDKWNPPEGVFDDNAHLMVQCMEAWFLADRETLAGFFGTGFQSSALPGRTDVENVSKKRLFDALQNATRKCRPKGRYDKGRHSFELLGQLDPREGDQGFPVCQASRPHADSARHRSVIDEDAVLQLAQAT